jgi:hypothetical protein
MSCLPYLLSSAQPGEAKSPLLLASPDSQPGRERLRHLIIGTPEGVRGAAYASQREWSRVVTILESEGV